VPLNLSFTHIMVVLIVALIVLGPEKLPDAARSIARVIRELRRMSSGLQAEVRDTFGDFAEPFSELVHAVAGGVADATGPPTPPLASPPAAGAPALEDLPSLGSPTGPFAAGPPVTPAEADETRPAGVAVAAVPAPGTFMVRPGSESGTSDVLIPTLGGPSSGNGTGAEPTS
jgi:Tat protein translocase TatB subunit